MKILKINILLTFIFMAGVLSGGGFDDLGNSARVRAMGGAAIALTGSPYSQFYNPAGVYDVKNLSVYTTYTKLFPGVEDDNLNYVSASGIIPMSFVGTLGVGGTFLNTELWKEYTIAGTYARELFQGLSVGGTLRLLGWSASAAPGESALSYTGLSFDIGACYAFRDFLPGNDLQFGLAVKDMLEPNISKSNNADAVVPRQIGAGAAYISKQYRYTVAADIVLERDMYLVRSGAEFSAFQGKLLDISTEFLVRFGYYDVLSSDFAEQRGVTAGFGLHLHSYALDYGYEYPFALLNAGSNHRISLLFNL